MMETDNQRLLHTFAALADLGQEIANTSDFEEMLRASFHLLLGSVAIRRGAVAQYDRARDTLRLIAARGIEQNQDSELAIDRDHARRLASLGTSLTLKDAMGEAARFMEEHTGSFVSAEIELLTSRYHHDWRVAGLSDHSALEVDLSLRGGSPPAAL